MVNRDVEKSLDLVGMQVHGHNPGSSCNVQHIGHQFCSYGNAGLVLTILARIAEIRQNGNDLLGRSAFCSVDHQEQFHQVFSRRESALNKKNDVTAYTFLE